VLNNNLKKFPDKEDGKFRVGLAGGTEVIKAHFFYILLLVDGRIRIRES
jgi:hypothetical protein